MSDREAIGFSFMFFFVYDIVMKIINKRTYRLSSCIFIPKYLAKPTLKCPVSSFVLFVYL